MKGRGQLSSFYSSVQAYILAIQYRYQNTGEGQSANISCSICMLKLWKTNNVIKRQGGDNPFIPYSLYFNFCLCWCWNYQTCVNIEYKGKDHPLPTLGSIKSLSVWLRSLKAFNYLLKLKWTCNNAEHIRSTLENLGSKGKRSQGQGNFQQDGYDALVLTVCEFLWQFL